ncbi:unnamed protein product [Prunus armeniaca]
MPPLYHKQPRRPRKKRMRSAGEQPPKSNHTATKLQRYNLETKCSLCRQGGHNRRSCPKAKEGTNSQVPCKLKVKKTAQDTTSTKRVTRQSRAKQPARRRLETGQCSQTPHGSETAQASQTATASQTAPTSQTALASQTSQTSKTAQKKRFKSPAKRI